MLNFVQDLLIFDQDMQARVKPGYAPSAVRSKITPPAKYSWPPSRVELLKRSKTDKKQRSSSIESAKDVNS
jgi:hypothetical protein